MFLLLRMSFSPIFACWQVSRVFLYIYVMLFSFVVLKVMLNAFQYFVFLEGGYRLLFLTQTASTISYMHKELSRLLFGSLLQTS